MFAFVSDNALRLILYAGTLAAFLVFLGGVAGVVLSLRSDSALQKVTQQLVDTQKGVSARTITPSQMEQLKASVDECWKGINIQVYDRSDPEAGSFAQSLEYAFQDAGFTTFPYELPTLEVGTGTDVALYLPGATGEKGIGKMLDSKLYKALEGFGLTLGGTTMATMLTRHEIRTEENEIPSLRTPDYCILMVLPRSPPRLSGLPYIVQRERAKEAK